MRTNSVSLKTDERAIYKTLGRHSIDLIKAEKPYGFDTCRITFSPAGQNLRYQTE